MYAEMELMYPYFSGCPQEGVSNQVDDFCRSQRNCAAPGTPSITGYNVWGEGGDLFNAPVPVLEDGLDPTTATMISCGGEDVSDIESSGQMILSDVFYECRKDLLLATKQPIRIDPPPFQKSVSSGCLPAMADNATAAPTAKNPSSLDLPVMEFGSVYGMRRAFSEGDMKTLAAEERKEKLSRYRSKKSKRNFGRKIKYACRKALADNQPRIRGRFAKT